MAVTLLLNAAPRTTQAVLGCETRNCSSPSHAHEYLKQQFPTSAPAKVAASMLWAMAWCTMGCDMGAPYTEGQDVGNVKTEGVSLGAVSAAAARAALGTSGHKRRRGNMDAWIAFRGEDLIDMFFERMADNNERTLKAARLPRYMLTQDGADDETLANLGKNWRLVSSRDCDNYMTLQRQRVCHCCTLSACCTCRLYCCPWRPSSLLLALCASYVLSRLLSLVPHITAARALRVICVGSCFGYLRPIQTTVQPVYYPQPQPYDHYAQPYEYYGREPVFAKYQPQPVYHGYWSQRAEHVHQEEQPPPPPPDPVVDEEVEVTGGDNLPLKKEEHAAVAYGGAQELEA